MSADLYRATGFSLLPATHASKIGASFSTASLDLTAGMVVREVGYKFKIGTGHVLKAYLRFGQHRKMTLLSAIFRRSIAILPFIGIIVGWALDEDGIVAVCVMAIILLFGAKLVELLVFVCALLMRHSWNRVEKISLGSPGLKIMLGSVGLGIRWHEFARASVFKDGVLLVKSPLECYWLPDSGLDDLSLKESVVVLLRNNVADLLDLRR